jgi:hypothetical protein
MHWCTQMELPTCHPEWTEQISKQHNFHSFYLICSANNAMCSNWIEGKAHKHFIEVYSTEK